MRHYGDRMLLEIARDRMQRGQAMAGISERRPNRLWVWLMRSVSRGMFRLGNRMVEIGKQLECRRLQLLASYRS